MEKLNNRLLIVLMGVCTILSVQNMYGQDQRERKRLIGAVNSRYEELKPVISNGNLYFVRTLHPGNKAIQSIWVSTYNQKNDTWSTPKILDENVNLSNRFNALCKVSENNRVFYLNNATTDKKSWNAGITKAIRTNSGWRYEEFYKCPFKSKGFVDFWVSEDDDLIFFSAKKSNRTNEDIYIVKSDSAGWKEPVLLEGVNSKFTEASPFYDAENRILYITSDRNGNFDIFGTQATDKSLMNWSTVTYSDFNTKWFEGYYTIGKNGGIFFVSQRTPQEQLDIYQYALPGEKLMVKEKMASLIITVKDNNTQQPVDASVQLQSGLKQVKRIAREGALEYGFGKDQTQTIKITVSQQGYYPQTREVLMNKKEVQEAFLLEPVEVGKTIILKNIFFDSDKAKMKSESYTELGMLAEFLSAHPTVKIKITGHSDDLGDDQYNLKLSQDRIETVLEYLVSKGVPAEQMVGEGMGEKQPIASNETEEGRAKNRRVEFTILEK